MKSKTFNSLFSLVSIVFLCACSAQQPKFEQSEVRVHADELIEPEGEFVLDAYDPLEGFNRRMYTFNTVADRYFFVPIVDGYQFIAPLFVEQGVTNFFNNIDELQNFLNASLQLDLSGSGTSVSRFLINTTIGVAGLFDFASDLGLPMQERDFGQTLGVYGFGPGAYLVLPLLGPSTTRDGFGRFVDAIPYSTINPISLQSLLEDDEAIYWMLFALRTVDARSNFDFRYYQSGSPFEYDLIRLLYLSNRKAKIESVKMRKTSEGTE